MGNGIFTIMASVFGGLLGGPTGFPRASVCSETPCLLIGLVPLHH